ncbi:carbon-nitrogen hydrolase family protein [Seongchinamella sediminis]|uniref:Carbon-nitrogen hydrolase family protein n=1 Tax=Seongchinamella sediminis TaxID=2283635 RepID=A0A3L7E2U8_9GAMM|nr:carbon-nitrogen hydrolase family protein [Seongchinamella sediminis]RLQ23409.1 carbon-nitrogen hydrolase family protein [Seongchinamella sediminis]
MSQFAIAGLQLEVSGKDNRYLIQKEIEKTLRLFPWVQMVVIGELATFGADKSFAQELPGDIENFYCRIAREHGIWLVPGSVYEKKGDHIYNTAMAIDPEGKVAGRYRKMFPFCPYEENIAAGTDFLVFDVPGAGRFGFQICYDQWFPETARQLAWMGAEVLLCPTMTNTVDRELELCLARANAISNQCYVVNVNVAGQLGNGRSIVVGPDGKVIHQAGELQETIPLELDIARVAQVRERGVMGLGQTLKSLRDSGAEFPVYRDAAPAGAAARLGPLVKPAAGRGGKLD